MQADAVSTVSTSSTKDAADELGFCVWTSEASTSYGTETRRLGVVKRWFGGSHIRHAERPSIPFRGSTYNRFRFSRLESRRTRRNCTLQFMAVISVWRGATALCCCRPKRVSFVDFLYCSLVPADPPETFLMHTPLIKILSVIIVIINY